eukprot:6197119-Pleurochrysis_carterae.AAC.1
MLWPSSERHSPAMQVTLEAWTLSRVPGQPGLDRERRVVGVSLRDECHDARDERRRHRRAAEHKVAVGHEGRRRGNPRARREQVDARAPVGIDSLRVVERAGGDRHDRGARLASCGGGRALAGVDVVVAGGDGDRDAVPRHDHEHAVEVLNLGLGVKRGHHHRAQFLAVGPPVADVRVVIIDDPVDSSLE